MFIIERIIGVSCYTLALLINIVLILKTKTKLSKIFIFYIFLLMVMALIYLPYKTADLYRIFNIVSYYGTLDWHTFYQTEVITSITPIAMILYWIFGKLNIGFLLPGFSCVLCYSLIFYIINDCAKKCIISRSDIALIVLFVMSTGLFMPIIAGIRMMISLCLIIFSFYKLYQAKKIKIYCLLLCVIALLIHSISIAVILIACLAYMFVNILGLKRILLFILIMGLLIGLYIFKDNSLLLQVFAKIEYYVKEDTYFNIWELVIALLSMIIELIIIYNAKFINRKMYFFKYFMIISIVTSVVFIFSFSIFYRLIVETNSLMTVILLCATFSSERNKANIYLRRSLLVLCIILLILNGSRGSLSALKFFEI